MPNVIDPLESTRPPVPTILLVGAIAALWLGALGIEIAARLMANAYARLGADLPDSTQALISAVRAFGHYVAAALCTLVLFVGALHRPEWFGAISTAVLAVALVAATAAIIVLAWPSGQCGEIRPDWPNDRTAQAQGGTAPVVCGKAAR